MGEKLGNTSSPGREAETTVAQHATARPTSSSPPDDESKILALGRFATGRRTYFPQLSTTAIMAAGKHAAMLYELADPPAPAAPTAGDP